MSVKKGIIEKEELSKPFSNFWLLNTDITPIFRPYSPSLPQRGYVYKPNNKVAGNLPVDVGYELSTIGLSCRQPLYGLSDAPWNPPLSMRLVPFEENKNSFTAKQVNDLLDNKELPFHKELTVNALDSNYCSPEYIVDTYGQDNLLNIIRMPSNRNVWKQLSEAEVAEKRAANKSNRGANSVYGTKYKLKEVASWGLRPDVQMSFGIKLANGKQVIVDMEIWDKMMIRSQRGKSMKDKPFRLVRVRLLDVISGETLFKKPMWLCVWGKRGQELTAEEIYWAYRNRYDIEHFFRFGKQKLLLAKYQTPDKKHLQNWLEVVNSSYWLLFVGKEEAKHTCLKWQQYDKNYKTRAKHDRNVSPSQVQQQMTGIILGFEQEPFLPKAKKKGKGRQVGQTQPKREQHPVLKKPKKKKKSTTPVLKKPKKKKKSKSK